MSYAALCFRLLLGVVFALSVFGTVRSRRTFTEFIGSVETLGGVAGPVARLTAVGVVVTELVVVATVIPVATSAAGLTLAIVLLGAFTFVLARALRRKRGVSCHCFGASDAPISAVHLVRNAFLMAAAVVGLILGTRHTTAGIAPAGIVLCSVVAVVAAGMVAFLDDLVALFVLPPALSPPAPRQPAPDRLR